MSTRRLAPVLIALVAAAAVALTVAWMSRSAGYPSIEDITNNRDLIGRRVVVQGTVQHVYADSLFTIAGEGVLGFFETDELLVSTEDARWPSGGGDVDPVARVLVAGTVRSLHDTGANEALFRALGEDPAHVYEVETVLSADVIETLP